MLARLDLHRPAAGDRPPWLTSRALPVWVPPGIAGFDIGIRCYCTACATGLEPDAVSRAITAGEARTDQALLVSPIRLGAGSTDCHACRATVGSDT